LSQPQVVVPLLIVDGDGQRLIKAGATLLLLFVIVNYCWCPLLAADVVDDWAICVGVVATCD